MKLIDLLSSVHKFKESDEIIIKMEEIYNTKTLNVNDTIQLGFSLGKAFHDIGEYDKAFHAYKRANQSRRQGANL